MTKLKLAVVGAGHLGRIHAKLLAQMPDVSLAGIVDPIEQVREKTASEFNCAACADHRELLERVDAAVIATPTKFHHRVALDFLEHGVPLLVEKPLAANFGEADDLVQTAELRGVLLQVGHIERFNPAFLAVAPHVGEPRYIEAVRASGFTGRSTDIGVVLDLMIHDIDLVLSMVGSPLKKASALGLAILGRSEDVAQARLEFEDGCVANLSASRVSTKEMPKREMQIWSESGFAEIDFGNRSACVVQPHTAIRQRALDFEAASTQEKLDLKNRLATELLSVKPLSFESRNALADELRDFVDCIRDGHTPRVTGQHGRDAIQVAEAVLEAIGRHQWHGHAAGPVGPLPNLAPPILRPPHWRTAASNSETRREAG